MGNDETASEAWSKASSFNDLCELTARFIEGMLPHHPLSCGADLEPETQPLRRSLAIYNRAGFMTTFSQPGEPLVSGDGQRAAVMGYARGETAKRIAALSLHTDLCIEIAEPQNECGYHFPITVQEYHPFTWCGSFFGIDELQHFARDCSRAALEDLGTTWQVCVIDFRWGRKRYLWKHVLDALTSTSRGDYRVEPSPDHGLDRDFVY